jgi:hypothetical protein
VTDDERTEGEEEEGLFSFAFQNIYVLFVVTKSRAIFQRKTLYELAKNLKNSSFSQVTKQADGTESRKLVIFTKQDDDGQRCRQLPKITMDKF